MNKQNEKNSLNFWNGEIFVLIKSVSKSRTYFKIVIWEIAWRIKDTLIIGGINVGLTARTHIHQFCMDTGCSLDARFGELDDRKGWKEKGMDINAWLYDDE